jgi:hypothetical protein
MAKYAALLDLESKSRSVMAEFLSHVIENFPEFWGGLQWPGVRPDKTSKFWTLY